jgi:hypothetical protein
MLFPDFAARAWDAHGCAPLIITGPELDAARSRIGAWAVARCTALPNLFSSGIGR